jgi:SPP1 family predicted phage head-tail adaptor
MSAGDLNKRITIQAPTKVSDGMGNYTVTWSTIATVYAAVWPVSAKERIQGMAVTTTITHRIRIRFRRVFRTGWRILYGGRYFNVVSAIDPNEDHEWLDLLCEEAK